MKDKLNILIANDDGIDSPGIVRLAEAAAKFGNVWVAAPSSQCSGMSQKLTIFGEFPVSRPAFPVPVMDAWSIGGTPADCVKLAVNFLPENGREGKASSHVCPYKGLDPTHEGFPFMSNHFPKVLPPNTISLGVRLQHMDVC